MEWRHPYLSRLLKNTKYIGRWPWGELETVRDPSTGDKWQEPRPPEETEEWVRHFPELQIVDTETFEAAQKILAENAERHAHRHREDGTFSNDQSGAAAANPLHLLGGLVVCGHCNRTLHIGGSFTKYLFCPGYKWGKCSCKTTLNRALAEELLLAEIGKRILENPAWLAATVGYARACWQERQRTLPNRLRDTEAALADVSRKIGRLVDSLEAETMLIPTSRSG